MRYLFIILSLIAIVYVQSQTVLLTPILPASAFQNQFYQVRFRVRNLVGARFQFKNVPSFFTASSDGLLSGVPTKQGLYAVEVWYFNQTFKQSKEVIFDVRRGTKLTNYNPVPESQQSSTSAQLKPKQQYLFTYNQNDQLNIQVNITNGQPPYTFEPIYIPTELQFNNKTGAIAGAFRKFGDYLIGLKIRDAKGKELQLLIKITIVIRNTTTPKFIFFQRSMIQVKFEVVNLPGNSTAFTLPSTDTNNQPKPATPGGSVNLPSNQQLKPVTPQVPVQPQTPTATKNDQAQTVSQTSTKPQSSSTIPNTSTPIVPTESPIPTSPPKAPSTTPIIPQSAAKQAEAPPQPTQIISTKDIINKNITNDVDMQKIQQQKDRLNRKLQKSKDQLKVCYQNIETTRNTVQNYLNTYTEQVNKVENLKNELQDLRRKSQRSSVDLEEKLAKLKSFQIDRMLAERQMKRSQQSYDNVNFAYNGSLANINKNLEDIKNLQNTIDDHKRSLDSSYRALDDALALNKKYEDEKLQVRDDIKKGMGLYTLINSTKSHSFGGCENYKFYQKSIGVGRIKKVIDKIYLLTNNHVITFGDCTESEVAKPGDIIEWKGYLQNGAVSALKIKKLK